MLAAFQNIRPEPNSVSDGLHQITVLRHTRHPADIDYASNCQHEVLKCQLRRWSKRTGQKIYRFLLQVDVIYPTHKDGAPAAKKAKRIYDVKWRNRRSAHLSQHRMEQHRILIRQERNVLVRALLQP
jgi:hypothetical protein